MRTCGFSLFSAPRLRVETIDASLARPFPPRLSSTAEKLLYVRPLASYPPTLPQFGSKLLGTDRP